MNETNLHDCIPDTFFRDSNYKHFPRDRTVNGSTDSNKKKYTIIC